MTDRPAWNVEFDCPQEQVEAMYVYLDDLRESAVTNMYGAAPFLAEAFDVPKPAARLVLASWMRTFAERHAEVTNA
jgi:hypothetical protein